MLRLLHPVPAVLLLLAASAHAQDIDDIRDILRDELQDAHFARSFGSLVSLSNEIELASAQLRYDNPEKSRLTTFAFPFHTVFHPWGEAAPGLYLEGVLGYAESTDRAEDIWGGQLPGQETSIAARWITVGGLAGFGVQVPVSEEFTVTPILNAGVSYLESKARYGGPGADLTSQIIDGIGFNWDAWAWSVGAAVRADWVRDIGETLRFESVARFDVRWYESFHEDDPAQEFSTRSEVATLRGDLVGPTGFRLDGQPLYWRATLGYRYFVDGALEGTRSLYQIGGGLELDVRGRIPSVGRLTLSAAVFLGENVFGWTFGAGFAF